MLNQLATATLRILFFRAGPQDFPYDPTLSRLIVPVAAALNYVLASMTLPPGLAAISSIAAVAGLSVATRFALRLRSLENRYSQTYHSLLATGAVMSLAFILPTMQLMPEVVRFTQNPELYQQGGARSLPAGSVLMFDLLLVWNFAVTANIFRQAMGVRVLGGVLVAMLVSLTLLMFVGLAASSIGALFGLTPPQPGVAPGV